MELRERGLSIIAAAARSACRARGEELGARLQDLPAGQVVGFVPALDRLAVREISARFVSQEERIEIADLRHAGLSVRRIARRLGRAPSTISRELRRNATTRRGIARSMRTVGRPLDGPAIIGAGSNQPRAAPADR